MYGYIKLLLIATAAQAASLDYAAIDGKQQLSNLDLLSKLDELKLALATPMPSQQTAISNERLNELQSSLNAVEKEFMQKLLSIVTNEATANGTLPTSCSEAMAKRQVSGVYHIYLPDSGLKPFAVYCQADEHDIEPWTIVQRRVDNETDFYRDWEEYRNGFGDLHGNFFIGLEKLHALTKDAANPQELWIQVQDNVTVHARYEKFAIGNQFDQYALNVLGRYSGNAGDSLTRHRGMKFSTKDVDNDSSSTQCAHTCRGAWWYKDCRDSNLNGVYGSKDGSTGLTWLKFRGYEVSMKYVHMAIRPAIAK